MKEQLISLESKSFGCMLEWLFLLCKEGINKNGAEMRLSVKAFNLSTCKYKSSVSANLILRIVAKKYNVQLRNEG